MKNLFLIIVSLLIYSCNTGSDEKSRVFDNIDTYIQMDGLSELSENLTITGEIKSFCFVNDTSFVISVSDPAMVVLYNTDGYQQKLIGRNGRGPFEYTSPSLVRSYNQHIYIWCNMQLKLLMFDSEGTPINEWKFDKGIRDFVVYKNYICFYAMSGLDEPLINIYDLTSANFINKGYGIKTREQEVLLVRDCSGGMDVHDNNLYFKSADEPCIYKLNFDDFSLNTFCIDDPEFKTDDLKSTPEAVISNIERLFEYLFSNSSVMGVYYTSGHIILQAEVGIAEINGFEFGDISQRKVKYYVFDEDINLLKTFRSEVGKISYCLFTSMGEFIYVLDLNEDFSNYVLKRFNFDNFL
jgi:hypothetical protein